MAKKISFNVIFASDEDPGFPATELNTHGPAVQGWRSQSGNNTVPHEIVLQFQNPAKIHRIQVLAHQYLIPEKIELWLHYASKGTPNTHSNLCFELLGFIVLSDNSSTNYKSRELQSVTVTPRQGTHLKLRLGAAIPNDLNPESQIALIAVNVLGEEIENEDEVTEGNNASNKAAIAPSDIPLQSQCDDLLFSMYVEESIGEIIREMENKKIQAVNDERFEYARKLKLCMITLRSAGERLGRYSLAKRQAVQQEDFTTAKLRKEQIKIYKNSVLKHLHVEQLLEKDGVFQENDLFSDTYASKPTLPSPLSLQDVAASLAESLCSSMLSPKSSCGDKSTTNSISSSSGGIGEVQVVNNVRRSFDETPSSPQLSTIGRSPNRSSPLTSQGSLRRRNKSAPRNSYEDYEERAIPAIRHSHTNEFLRECQGSGLLESDLNRGRSRLNDRERRQAALPILVFGNDLVEQFYSRQFQDREEGLVRLRNFLKEGEIECSAGANKIARSAALLLHRAVRDAVFSVFSQATETLRVLFLEFVPNRVSSNEVARCVDRLLPELLAKSGDPSPRIHTLAQHTILSIAACPEVRNQHLVAPALSRTVSSGTHPRLALSRMQMLEQLVLSQGINTDKHSGLTCRVLSECGCSGIHHPAEPVRKVAERILLLVYKVNPRLVRKQLPPDDDITRRNLLYRQLFSEFDKLDMQRKKEMLEASKQFSDQNNQTTSSRSARNDKNQLLNINKNKYDIKGSIFDPPENKNESDSSSMIRSETRILKAKNSHGTPEDERSLKISCNGKQEYNEKLKQSMNSVNSRKSSNSNSEGDEQEIIRCAFCDWNCEGDQSQLDKHYWKACPFLTKCPQCSQVLEVAVLNFHLTNECEAKASFVTCERCTESVHKGLYELHLMEDYCRELKTGCARCPLCHDDVHYPLDGGWKLHLLSSSGCPGNARRRSKI